MIDVPVEVKDALREGRLKKNYRVVVLNDDGTEDFTIDNDTLVSESVSIDERMCSGDTIKFGLCEGSSLEFQYFDHPNITDRQVKVFCDVEYGANQPYTIPMGFFTVKKCSRQASTGIIKVTAYNKLQSDYLDQKANQMLLDDFEGDPSVELTMYDIQKHLLDNYAIVEAPKESIDLTGVPTTLGANIGSMDKGLYYYADYDTPLSLRMLLGQQSISQQLVTVPNFGLFVDYVAKKVDVATNNYWEISLLNGIDVLMSNIKNYMVDIIDEAKWTINGSVLTRAQVVQMVENAIIGYISINNTTYPMSSASVETINNLVNREAASITFALPKSMGFCYSSEQYGIVFSNPVKFNNEYEYRYYIQNGSIYVESDIHTRTPLIYDGNGNLYTGKVEDYCIVNLLQLSDAEKTLYTIEDIPEFTLRDVMTATYETVCQFGKLDRVTDLFSGVELNHSRLLPQDTLYPSDSLYPYGSGESAFKSQYSKLWADEGNIHKWRYLIITYKGLDGEGNEADFTLQRTINNDGTDDYNCSDNWLFRNLVWTEAQIGTYADAMKAKMQDITWFPFEMWCAGLPYLETGDEIEIPLGNQTYTSYILQRQLKGIQNLQDTYINGTLDIF